MKPEERSEVSRDVVVGAYQALLGRQPESEQVIRKHIEQNKSVKDLLSAFLNSAEFKQKTNIDYRSQVGAAVRRPLNSIDVEVPPEMFSRLFERVRDQWMALGQSEPFWSVLSHARFRMANIEKSKGEFYSSGESSAGLIDIFCERSKVKRPSGNCLELGCGVGRVTRFLSKRFDNVTAIDISEGNLNLAREYLHESAVSNVDFLLLRNLDQLTAINGCDFFYSIIVLQHNPPPIIARILRIILKNLRNGGGFLFQVPTHRPGYNFRVDAYLESHDPVGVGFEMHSIPMNVVLDIIRAAGGQIKEVMADTSIGGYGSYTFFGIKP